MKYRALCWLFLARTTGSTESATSGTAGVLVISEWEEEDRIAGRAGVGEEDRILSTVKIPILLPGEYSSVEFRRE